jgi:hypothetical protein
MTEEIEAPYAWMKWDVFRTDQDSFERDAHILILGTLHAGVTYLNTEAQKEEDDLAPHLKIVKGQQRAAVEDKIYEIWGYVGDQERFLRNMALVALIARLTHTLNSLARSAETFASRDPKGCKGSTGDDEFKVLWKEYEARFGIKFGAKLIQWIEPLRKARNLIVHKGGEANPLKPADQIDNYMDFENHRDFAFSKKYPRLVEGDGYSAEVRITDKQIEKAVEKAVDLVRYAAKELRAKQKEHTAINLKAIAKKSAKKASA